MGERTDQVHEGECAICAEPFEEPRQLPCSHIYCVQCLERWVYNEGQLPCLTCPTCREEFQLPEDGGVRELPPPVPDVDDSDDLDVSSFEVVLDVGMDNQPSTEQPETSDVQTDNSQLDQNVSDVMDDVINRNVSLSSTYSEGSQQLDNEIRINSPAEQQENEPGAYCCFYASTTVK